jgi:hypothetical protein
MQYQVWFCRNQRVCGCRIRFLSDKARAGPVQDLSFARRCEGGRAAPGAPDKILGEKMAGTLVVKLRPRWGRIFYPNHNEGCWLELRGSSSWPDLGFPGQVSAGCYPGDHQQKASGRRPTQAWPMLMISRLESKRNPARKPEIRPGRASRTGLEEGGGPGGPREILQTGGGGRAKPTTFLKDLSGPRGRPKSPETGFPFRPYILHPLILLGSQQRPMRQAWRT